MSAYTISSDNIYFLNDKNIVSSLGETSKTGFNAIPSHDLFVDTYKELSSVDKAASDSINSLSVGLSTEIQKLSSNLSTDIETLSARLSEEIDTLSIKLSGDIDSLTGNLSAEINRVSGAASLSIQNLSSYAKNLSDETAKTFRDVSNAVNAQFVHLSGDAIKFLDVEERLSVNGILNIDPSTESIGINADIGINASGRNVNLTSEKFTTNAGKYQIYGDERQMFINNRTLEEIEKSLSVANFEYRSDLTCLMLTFEDGKKLSVDAGAFIKDGMVDNVKYESGYLIFTFNTEAGKDTISVDVKSFVKYYTAGDGLKLDDLKNEFSVDFDKVASKKVVDDALSSFAHNVKFEGHLNYSITKTGISIEDILEPYVESRSPIDRLKNGLMLEFHIDDEKNSKFEITPRHGVSSPIDESIFVGDGDVIILHKRDSDDIRMDEIYLNGNQKTVFVFHPAIPRYEFEDKIEYLSNEISNLSTSLSSDIQNLSTSLSNEISNLSTSLFSDIQNLSADLSTAISSKVFISSYIPEEEMHGPNDLSIIKIAKDNYETLVANDLPTLSANTLYVVDSDYIDAYGQVISNLTMDENDPSYMLGVAATKPYVDNEVVSLLNKICATSSEIVLSCTNAINQTTNISSVLFRLHEEINADSTIQILSENCELGVIAKAVVMMFKALSSIQI